MQRIRPTLAWLKRIDNRLRPRLWRWLVDRLPIEPWFHERIYHWSIFGMLRDETIDPRVSIGKHTYGVRLGAINLHLPDDHVTIGSYCSIAEGVRFVFGEHSLATVSTFPLRTKLLGEHNTDAFSKGRVEVGNDVWIGTNALILSGIKIGHGSVIAAGAVVTKDVPPYALVGGVPAKGIKMRFSPPQVASLLTIAWWDWPEDKIVENINLFYTDVDTFIRKFTEDAPFDHAPADHQLTS